MARIEFRNLGHSYRPNPQSLNDYALQPMNMTWRDGGAYALLGPSGCGKSTLLNIISGLLTPSEGQVLFDDRDVTHASPRERNIAQVFQFPVIYDTMTVFDNLAFPLRNRKTPEAEVKKRVEEVAEILELQHALKRRASGLAADAKQKGAWFRREYNQVRPHSSLGYQTPREFSEECDRGLHGQPPKETTSVSDPESR